MRTRYGLRTRGVTLIELMVVIALVGIVVALVGPSLRQLIETQRVRGINAGLVTDLQFARSEAATRGTHVRVTFRSDAAMSCYTIYTYAVGNKACNCLAANPCTHAGFTEIRTVRHAIKDGVNVYPSEIGQGLEFAFEPLVGGLYEVPNDDDPFNFDAYTIRTFIDAQRELRTIVGKTGRPTVCAPTGSKIREVAC